MKIENYSKLYSIFTRKDWHSRKDYNDSVFNNFCKLLSNLNDNQQSLILELTERYEWLSINEYNSTLIKIFNNIPKEEIDGTSKIYLFPVVRTDEEFKTKSGHGILFMLRGIKPFLKNFKNGIFKEVEKYDFFKNDFKLLDTELIYLLDDFLGSGSTIESTINELKESSIPLDKIRVITIASHTQAIEYLQSNNIIYYVELITRKGISEYYAEDILNEKIELMEQIEKLIPKNKFKFGYAQSEALITLYRTPNNTFPIFWHDYVKDEVTFKAPFPRY